MREIKITKYLTLKLEGKTIIYINSKRFGVLKIPESPFFDEVQSADKPPNDLNAEIEFLWHCSNLQAWVKNNYEINLLNSDIYFSLLSKLTFFGDSKAKRVFKEEILKRLETGIDKTLRFILKNHYLGNTYSDFFTRDELLFIYKNYVSKYESLGLLLPFLRTLSFEKIPDVDHHYKKVVKNKLLTENYKEKVKVLKHIDILDVTELLSILGQLKLKKAKKGNESKRFRVLSSLMYEIQNGCGGTNFSMLEVSRTLLVENEQTHFLDIINSSNYPWVNLDFEADVVRRRYWQGELYFDVLEGHVKSIELCCDSSNSKIFYDNLQKLKNFRKLNNVNLLVFCEYDDEIYNQIRYSLIRTKRVFGLSSLENVGIYVISESSIYLNKIMDLNVFSI